MLPKAPSFVVAKIAFNTDGARRQRTISMYSLRAELLAAHPSHWINTVAPLRLAVQATLILANGSSATVSPSIGRIIPTACTKRSNERPSMLGAGCGRAATLNPGYIEPASEPADALPDVRTTRMPILRKSRMIGRLPSDRAIVRKGRLSFLEMRRQPLPRLWTRKTQHLQCGRGVE